MRGVPAFDRSEGLTERQGFAGARRYGVLCHGPVTKLRRGKLVSEDALQAVAYLGWLGGCVMASKAEERMKQGLCSKCGSEPLTSKYFGDKCLAERRDRARQLRGGKK